MSPAEAAPRVQSNSAPPISSTGSVPASVISQKRKAALVAPKSDGGAAVARERVERRLVLVHAVAEELDRGDVGERVDHLAGHHRPGGGAGLGAGADPRHVVADQHRVAASQTAMPSASQRLIWPITATAPTMAVTARPRVLTDSVTASVIARAVCCCFWAMRPAKSSSKKLKRLPEGVAVQPRQHQRVEVGAEGQRVQRRAEPHQAGPQHQEEDAAGERARASCRRAGPPARATARGRSASRRPRPRRPRWRRPRSRRRARSRPPGRRRAAPSP